MAELYRRGGRKSIKGIIEPHNINGRVQEIRESNARKENGGCGKRIVIKPRIPTQSKEDKETQIEQGNDEVLPEKQLGKEGEKTLAVSTSTDQGGYKVKNDPDMMDKYAHTYAMERGIPAIHLTRKNQNPAAPNHPLDMEMFDPALIENPIFAVKNATDEWAGSRDQPAEAFFGDEEVPTPRKQSTDERWGKEKRVGDEYVSFYIRNWMGQLGEAMGWEVAYTKALGQLAKKGTNRDRIIAEQCLLDAKQNGSYLLIHWGGKSHAGGIPNGTTRDRRS